ncbi:RNA polymerase sigma-70 factor [Saprospiraceae bacterium]|nr:RNA polymerase sigma-70 factor [Saprospiraceae bacterium]
MTEFTDQDLISLLKDPKQSEHAAELLFKKYYSQVCYAVYRIIPETSTSEDIAQDVFLEIWRKRETIDITSSVKAYLKRAGVNKALNYIRSKKKVKFENDDSYEMQNLSINDHGENVEVLDLQSIIDKAIDSLPERCRIVFSLSRFEELSYKEIAGKLDISVKTVENQIGKALKILRSAVEGYK